MDCIDNALETISTIPECRISKRIREKAQDITEKKIETIKYPCICVL